jgi:hypothetical protein
LPPSSQLPRPGAKPGASAPNRFYMYGVIGRLAMLAASYELEATDPEAGSSASTVTPERPPRASLSAALASAAR